MPRMPLSGVRISCETIVEEPRLGTVGRFGLIARFGERAFGPHAVGDVAADALHLARAVGAHDHFAPRDPAGAIDGGDFLVMTRAPSAITVVSLCSTTATEAGADQALRGGGRPARKRRR